MSEDTFLNSPSSIQAVLSGRTALPGLVVRRTAAGDMQMSVVVRGTIKGTATELEMALDNLGQQLNAQGEMPYTELTRAGQMWSTMQVLSVAALVVRPTTVTGVEIWNGNTQASLVVDRLFAHNLVGVANSAMGLYAMVTTPKAAPSAGANVTINGNSGKGYSGGVIVGLGTTVVANGWYPYGPYAANVTITTPGPTLEAQVMGRLIVPPGCSLCVTTVASTTGVLNTHGASWEERVFPAGYGLG